MSSSEPILPLSSVMPSEPSLRLPKTGRLDEDPLFAAFWAVYPRKVGKGAARRGWQRAMHSGADAQKIIMAAERFRDRCRIKGTAQEYIPHPVSWLSAERYGDEEAVADAESAVPAEVPRSQVPLNDEQLLAAVIRLAGDGERPVTAATAIIRTVRRQMPSSAPEGFPMVSTERGQTLAEMPYPEYLETPEWQARRRVALKRAGYRCQVCNRERPMHVHHRTYERRGMEEPGDLTVLCDVCHALYHGKGLLAGPEGEVPGEPQAAV